MDLGNLKVQTGGKATPRYAILTICDSNTNSIDLLDGGPFHDSLSAGRCILNPITGRSVEEQLLQDIGIKTKKSLTCVIFMSTC